MSARHTHSGRWKYGMSLAFLTAITWGVLPVFLSPLFAVMDPMTITFYRFLMASILLFIWLVYKNSFKQLTQLKDKKTISRVFIAGCMLCVNYGGYAVALEMMSPAGTQVLIQLAPILLILSGVFIFHERFSRAQWLGFATFMIGLTVFFWKRILQTGSGSDQYALGMLIIVFAAVSWAVYASLQKQLLMRLSSVQLIFLINTLGALVFSILSSPLLIFELNNIQLLLLLACGLNTLIAYGSFSEALEHWEASKISALFTTVPVLTIIFVEIANLLPNVSIPSEPVSANLVIGALLVVVGAAFTSLGQKNGKENL